MWWNNIPFCYLVTYKNETALFRLIVSMIHEFCNRQNCTRFSCYCWVIPLVLSDLRNPFYFWQYFTIAIIWGTCFSSVSCAQQNRNDVGRGREDWERLAWPWSFSLFFPINFLCKTNTRRMRVIYILYFMNHCCQQLTSSPICVDH